MKLNTTQLGYEKQSKGRSVLIICFAFREELFGTLGDKVCSLESYHIHLQRLDSVLISFHCLVTHNRTFRHSYPQYEDSATSMTFVVIWLLATKCSLVFKYILKFTGYLKKNLVTDCRYPSIIWYLSLMS